MTNPYWNFTKPNPKYGYINNPFQSDTAEHTNKHHPCGYWPAGEIILAQPTVMYTLWSGGRYAFYATNRAYGDENIFLPADDTSYFYDFDIGDGFGLFIKSDKTLWGIGNNGAGQLGTGDKTTPGQAMVQIGTDSDWESVACSASGSHSLATKENGSLWATGYNAYGQLGLGHENEVLEFTQVGGYDWDIIETVTYGSYATQTDGSLWSWGFGTNGNLGHGNTQDYNIPTLVSGAPVFASLTAGYFAVIGLTSAGKLWGCGYNTSGQLALDNTTSTNVFVERSAGESWSSVNLHERHTLLIKSDGTLWGCGFNQEGQTGSPASPSAITTVTQAGTASNWVQAETGFRHSMVLNSLGELYSCGQDTYGQLARDNITTPYDELGLVSGTWGSIKCGDEHNFAGKTVNVW
jgi:alpha-tubulin suppressor-like RCC1 family protein